MNLKQLLEDINEVTGMINAKDLDLLVGRIESSKRIYLVGEGRSGLVAKSFAMRLARLDKLVYVVGETVTPQISEGDLLIAITGSGETKTVLETVKIFRVLKGNVICISAQPDSAIVRISHEAVIIPANLPKRIGHVYQLRELVGVPERPPHASTFELATMIFLEAVSFELEHRWQKNNRKEQLLPS
jgi:6-phospho 3-hexuloisomerase